MGLTTEISSQELSSLIDSQEVLDLEEVSSDLDFSSRSDSDDDFVNPSQFKKSIKVVSSKAIKPTKPPVPATKLVSPSRSNILQKESITVKSQQSNTSSRVEVQTKVKELIQIIDECETDSEEEFVKSREISELENVIESEEKTVSEEEEYEQMEVIENLSDKNDSISSIEEPKTPSSLVLPRPQPNLSQSSRTNTTSKSLSTFNSVSLGVKFSIEETKANQTKLFQPFRPLRPTVKPTPYSLGVKATVEELKASEKKLSAPFVIPGSVNRNGVSKRKCAPTFNSKETEEDFLKKSKLTARDLKNNCGFGDLQDGQFYLMKKDSKYFKEVAKIFRPFKIPYTDPVKLEECRENDPRALVLGMRPRNSSQNLLRPLHDPDAEGALVLYRPEVELSEMEKMRIQAKVAINCNVEELPEIPVVVDPKLAKVLRPHQIEGVKFLYNCTTGRIMENAFGCIMADEMGLGKTLQCIALLWTLLRQSPIPTQPTADRCLIVCPSTLVKNWANELEKWIGKGRVKPVVCDHKPSTDKGTVKEQLTRDIQRYLSPTRRTGATPVAIISYENLRNNVEIFGQSSIGLVLCDEGHRLKNSNSQLFVALNQLNAKRRVILSGTPIQNDLSEYFSLLNFANPGLLGTPNQFRRDFELPILRGRDGIATQKERDIGDAKLHELNTLCSKFIIRRTNDLLSKYLPTKYEYVVFCKLSPTQQLLYDNYLRSHNLKDLAAEKNGQQSSRAFKAMTTLKNMCNHPKLYDNLEKSTSACKIIEKYEQQQASKPTSNQGYSRKSASKFNIEWSSKFWLLDRMLADIKKHTDDKMVLISNYTKTLEMLEKLCRSRGYTCIRLDGSMTTSKRAKIIDQFNDPDGGIFIFLLSSKAGGCGVNLVGANRLILFDPDWNPANDQQALARVWRDGQKKTCYIYRLIAAGSIEEKIFQRQSHKQTLSSCVVDAEANEDRHFSRDELRELFSTNNQCWSETHDKFQCQYGCDKPDRENANYGNLASWSHFPPEQRHKVADSILKSATTNFDMLAYVFQFNSHAFIKN